MRSQSMGRLNVSYELHAWSAWFPYGASEVATRKLRCAKYMPKVEKRWALGCMRVVRYLMTTAHAAFYFA